MNAVAPNAPNRCWKVAEWPQQDQAAWAAAGLPGDPLCPGGLAARWAEATRRMVENGYGRWIGFLDRSDLLDLTETTAQRATKERVMVYREDLATSTAPFSVLTRLRQLGKALSAMCPEHDWSWILRGADRLRANATSLRPKRERLQPSGRLATFGKQLMDEADISVFASAKERAVVFRDGLLIGLLAHRPIRARNLTMIECGRHLMRRGEHWWLVFDASETKTWQPYEQPWPAGLATYLDRYLAVHRQVLLGQERHTDRPPTRALWISLWGKPMGYAAISHQVRQRTNAAFGRAITPHLFRDCVSTTIATEDPEQVQLIADLLGHASLAMSERHYNHARSLEACRRYQETIAARRRRLK